MTGNTPQIEAGTSRNSSSVVGAIVALALGCLLLALAAVVQPFGSTMALFERPDILIAALAVVTALGWRLGHGTARTGWWRAVGGGVTFGLLLPPIGLLVGVIAGAADTVIRGAANPLTVLGPTAAWAIYGLILVCFYGWVFAIPAGIVWALTTRALSRIQFAPMVRRSKRPTARFAIALVAIGLAAGTAQAITYAPRDARCLDLQGGSPTDAAFSPAGDLLAVTLQSDPNQPGSVVLMRWPSGEVIDSWSAWVDQEVAVDPSGRVYWPAWILSFSGPEGESGDGVYTATPESDPVLLATGDESELNDLTWTSGGLRGTTPNSHQIARIPLTGGIRIEVTHSSDEVGAFWSSADGTVTVTGPGYFGTTLEVATASGTRSVPISGDARSVALSADGQTIVEAGWFDGTRLIDVQSGNSRLILRGSQTFVALSEKGDLAWANEEQFGHGHLCTSTLERLG
jgi:hypothetical protein